jgi:uncharacterized protein YgiM (DUF1202 family)
MHKFMHKFMHRHIAIILIFVTTFILFTLPVAAAPAAQTTLPDFTLNANTVISVTIAVTDGQVIVVPVHLAFVAKNHDGEADVSLITNADQQGGMFIGVAPAHSISATLQLPQLAGSATPVPSGATQAVNGTGTHVANRNSNLRSGPGTEYPVTGSVRKGDAVTVVDQNSNRTWYKLDNGKWIAAFLVDPIQNNNRENNNSGNNNSGSNSGNGDQNSSGEATPSQTPSPTLGPTETPTETPTPPAEQGSGNSYVLAVSSIGAGAQGAINSLSDLVGNAQPLTPEWRDDVAAQLSVLSDALDQLLALAPAPGYEELHSEVTDVALTCEQSLDYLRGGLNDPLSIDPNQAIQSTQNCAGKATKLNADVQAAQ